MESRKRSFIKALSWRLLALLITMSVAWFIFRDARVAASVGIIDSLVKIAVYYLHERFWQRVSYGRPRDSAVQSSGSGTAEASLKSAGASPS